MSCGSLERVHLFVVVGRFFRLLPSILLIPFSYFLIPFSFLLVSWIEVFSLFFRFLLFPISSDLEFRVLDLSFPPLSLVVLGGGGGRIRVEWVPM